MNGQDPQDDDEGELYCYVRSQNQADQKNVSVIKSIEFKRHSTDKNFEDNKDDEGNELEVILIEMETVKKIY